LVGSLEQRPFIIDTQSSQLRYLSLGFPIVSDFRFVNDDELLFYVPEQPNIEEASVYRYHIQSEQVDLLYTSARNVVNTQIKITTSDNQESHLQASVIQTNKQNFIVEFSNNVPSVTLQDITLMCDDCWQVHDAYLY